MNGNLWEWVSDWSDPDTWSGSAPSDYGSDYQYPHPAAFIRGGHWYDGANSGVFALNMDNAPSDSFGNIGFRCCQ
jgi:formylglycine-generating enzyme required for sulfatase activity